MGGTSSTGASWNQGWWHLFNGREQREKVLTWHNEQLMKYLTSVMTTWGTTFELLSTAERTD